MPVINIHFARRGKRHASAGFTLLELSAVLVIISILVSLLSAALNTSRARALQIGCLNNNLKQLALAWIMYADDNEDNLPLNRTAPGTGNNPILGRRSSTNSWVVGNPREDATTANIERGSLFPYIKSTQIYRCSMDKSKVANTKRTLRTRSYSMNAYMNGDNAGLDPRVKTRASEIVNPPPSRVFVFIEEHENSIWGSSFMVLPLEKFNLTSGSWTSTPADRHNQGCNLSFADGHVEYWRWYWPKRINLNNRITSNSKELKDLRRLQSGVPKP